MGNLFGYVPAATESKSDDETKRVVEIYYNDMKQAVAFYHGANAHDIETVIKKTFRLPLDWNVNFVDEDGIPVVLGGCMPNGIKIYMSLSKSYPQKNSNVNINGQNDNVNINGEMARSNNNNSNDKDDGVMKAKEKLKIEDYISDDMKEFDESSNERGVILSDKVTGCNNVWHSDNNADWPYQCHCKNGIRKCGVIYKYTIEMSTFKRENAMYWQNSFEHESICDIYHHFGMIFENEIGSLNKPTCMRPMCVFEDETTKRKEAIFDIVIDLRNENNVNNVNDATATTPTKGGDNDNDNDNNVENGIYFILKPENRCVMFAPLFGKLPNKNNALLFGFWTKIRSKIVVKDVSIMEDEEQVIVPRNKIENYLTKEDLFVQLSIKKDSSTVR